MNVAPLPVGLSPLSDAASSLEGEEGARLQARLASVQALVGDELREVEALLAQVSAQGPAPGTEAARHLVLRGGKRVRPTVLLLSAACFGEVSGTARALAVVAELIHSATLLHDDVVDEGDERRGAPTARRVHGNAVSVLAGDLLLVHALRLTEQALPSALADLIQTLGSLVGGEIIQLRGRRELDLSPETYDAVLRGKTASLFSWATRLGARVGGASPADEARLGTFGEGIGVAFQLVDDALDYTSEETGKTLLADLREGKLTLPLVVAAERDPGLAPLLAEIHAGRLEQMDEVRRRVLESGACDEVRRRADEITERALSALAEVPASPARGLLDALARQLTARRV